jgi:ribonuclease HI
MFNNYTRNPFFSLTTLNVTSLCSYSNSHESKARRSRIIRTLTRLLKYDFILLQETKLLAFDLTALRQILHTHKIFYNNNPNNLTGVPPSAGTLIAVKHSILTNYDVNNLVVIPGHCQTLQLTPYKPDWPHITVTNVRLFTGPDKSNEQNTQISKINKSLLDIKADLRYLAGDLNFTTYPDESTSTTTDTPDSWPCFLHTHSFAEVQQPDHTYIFHSPTTSKFSSSKIDKVFISFPEPEWLLATPKAHTNEDILADIKSFKASLPASDSTNSICTHIPVCLSFYKQSNKPKVKRTIYHQNVFNDPNFLPHFNTTYKPLNSDPVAERANFKAALITAYNLTLNKSHAPRRLYQYAICAKALRELDNPNPSSNYIQSLIKHNSFLSHLISWNGLTWDSTNLRKAINYLLTDGIPDPASNLSNNTTTQPEPSPLSPGSSRNSIAETLKRIKLSLPSTKKRVSALRASRSDEPTSDPIELGQIIEDHYGKLWSGPSADAAVLRGRIADEYLDDYQCPLPLNPLPELTIEHVKKAILTSGNSAPGPDGLPFIAYRRTVDVSALILLNYAKHLPNSPTDLDSFNLSTLLLLPKNDSCLVTDTRPLCINNTDNRLIAFALVILITPTVDVILDSAQQGFVKGRLMTKHLRDLNKEFYAKWSSDEEYYVLMTDNAKAFDSIEHDFIFKTLAAQHFPAWFVSTVRSLLSNASTNPTLCPSTSIPIARGVKQGCPLSPILFVLIYDPLIRALKRCPDLLPKAAADDLAVSSASLDALFATAMPAIDSFCAASGMGINKDKTQILTSTPLEDPIPLKPTSQVLPIIDLTVPLPPATPAKTKKRKRCVLSYRKRSTRGKEPEVTAVISKRWNPYQHPGNAANHKGTIFGFWEYEVLWEGYGLDRTTWEPLENLSNCKESVKDYNATTADPPTYAQTLAARFHRCPWKDIKFVDSTKYLGIIFSNSKDAYQTKEANFRPVLDAARKRFNSFRTVLKRSSLMHRILITNVYISSLFSYKISFMTIPYPIYHAYKNLVARSIISYGGSGYIYEHLTAPTCLMGLKTHINDIWVQCMMLHLRRSKLKGIKSQADLPWPLSTKDDKFGIYYHSPIFEDNTNHALMEFLGKGFLQWNGQSDLSALKDKSIKRTLIQCGLHTGPPVAHPGLKLTERAEKLNHIFKLYNTTPTSTLEHFSTLDPCTPNHLLTHHLKLYTYALETDRRIRYFAPNASAHPARSALTPYPCYFCSKGDDTLLHIYDPTSCPVVKSIIADLAVTHDIHHQALIDTSFASELTAGNTPLFIMNFPKSNSKSLDKASFVLALNYSIWQLRNLVRAGGVPGAYHKFALRQLILKFKPYWSNPKGKKPSGTLYGSASSRSEAQKERALKDALQFVSSIPPAAGRIYTDGSSLGNPGPAGSGALVVGPTGPGPPSSVRLFCPLCTVNDVRSNNFAELWAIGMAISFILDKFTSRPQMYILSDSKFIIDLLNRNAFSYEFENLVAHILALKNAYSARSQAIRFCWVPGHVGLSGNEAADELANIGSSTPRRSPLCLPTMPDDRFEYCVA